MTAKQVENFVRICHKRGLSIETTFFELMEVLGARHDFETHDSEDERLELE